MRKITALIMMALLVTIGGVYASWLYATGGAVELTEKGIGINMVGAQADNETTIGYFDFSDNLIFDIDDPADDGILHKAVLVPGATSSIKITFTPNPAAGDAAIEDLGIAMRLTVSVHNPNEYEGRQILSIAEGKEVVYSPVLTYDDIDGGVNEKVASGANEIGKYYKEGANFVWEITAEEALSMLVLNEGEDLFLDTMAEHALFTAAVSNIHIDFTVEHYVSE